MIRRGLPILAAAVILGVVPAAVEAACTKTGTLVQVVMKDSRVKGAHTLAIRDKMTDPFYFRATTNDDDLAGLAATLAAQQTRVALKGSASKCPSNPKTGGASIGKVIDLTAAP